MKQIDHCEGCYYYCWEVCNNIWSDDYLYVPTEKCRLWIPGGQSPINRGHDDEKS